MPPFSPRPPRPPAPAALLLAAGALSLVTGCSYLLGARSEPPRLFVLGTVAATRTHVLPAGTVLGLGPVDLPAYLDRRGIVRRIDANRIEESRADLWAEPLGAGFRSVLEQNLRLRLPGVPIRTFPWPVASQPDLAVAVEVTRFERTSGETVELVARWSARHPQDGAVLVESDAAIVEPVAGPGTEDVVAAMSGAAAELGDQIATALARQAGARPSQRRAGER